MAAYCPESGVAFIHTPKAAGWSVKRYMADHLPATRVPDDREYADWPATADPGLPIGHLALRDWQAHLGSDPRDYDLVLAVRRDPYERELSQYLYWRWIHEQKHGHGIMVQHAIAMMHPTFTRWLRDPRSQYHVRYDYHDQRPPRYLSEPPNSYADYGGFYRYWLAVDGEIPDNVEVVDITELDERLPELLEPYAGGRYGVPTLNEGGPEYTEREHYTEEAARIVESRYEFAFSEWYERREPWRGE